MKYLLFLLNTVIGLLYFGGLFASIAFPNSNAANPLDSWDKAFKAVLGHLVIPGLLLLHFFLFANSTRDLKIIIKKDSWKIMLYIGIYMAFAIYRFLWLKATGLQSDSIENLRQLFPYWFLSPDILTWWGLAVIAIILLAFHSGLFILYAYAGNKTALAWEKYYKKKISK